MKVIEKKLGLFRESKVYLIPHEKYGIIVKLRKEGSLIEQTSLDEGLKISAYPSKKMEEEIYDYQMKN